MNELEERIQDLERIIKDLEQENICIGCKSKYNYDLPLCDICEHHVCYFCIKEGSICPRKICTFICQMLKDIKTD